MPLLELSGLLGGQNTQQEGAQQWYNFNFWREAYNQQATQLTEQHTQQAAQTAAYQEYQVATGTVTLRTEDPLPLVKFKVGQIVKITTDRYEPVLKYNERVKVLEVTSHHYNVQILTGPYAGETLNLEENFLNKLYERNLPSWW